MAGYLFLLDSIDSLNECIRTGTYSTRVSPPTRGWWGTPVEGTFADYATMHAGDNVYFFIKRRIYGIGELIDTGLGPALLNYPGASQPETPEFGAVRINMLLGESREALDQRWVCTFRPAPFFFLSGVDMDDVLESEPGAFRMLRAIWKLSFIKFDDEENQAFKNAVLRANQVALLHPEPCVNVFRDEHATDHHRIRAKATEEHRLTSNPMVEACAEGEALRHEMAIEAGTLWQLACGDPGATSVFGAWDYLSHQVIASPFKPVDYMDKMDLFGYRFIKGYAPTIGRYLVGEIKRGSASIDDVEQLLKYVDWVKNEYAHGDYSMIEAFLIAYDFPSDTLAHISTHAHRTYTHQRRPARSGTWNHLAPVLYRHVGNGRLEYRLARPTIESLTTV